MILILALKLLLIFLLTFFIFFKRTKQELADYYGISKKTLAKWVTYCSPNISIKEWNKKRKLNFFDVSLIYSDFGFVEEEYKPLSKGEILEKCETQYHTIRENIALNLEKLKINKDTYLSLDIFPPKLSFEMLELLGE